MRKGQIPAVEISTPPRFLALLMAAHWRRDLLNFDAHFWIEVTSANTFSKTNAPHHYNNKRYENLAQNATICELSYIKIYLNSQEKEKKNLTLAREWSSRQLLSKYFYQIFLKSSVRFRKEKNPKPSPQKILRAKTQHSKKASCTDLKYFCRFSIC